MQILKVALALPLILASPGPATPQQSGTFSSIGAYPVPSGTLSFPFSITRGPDGAMWFTEFDANNIGRVTVAGAVTEFPVRTPFSEPAAITTGPDGALWFTELLSNNIGRMTTAGAVTEYPLPSPNSAGTAIAPGPDGALWFTENFAGKIGRITTAGIITEYLIPPIYSTPAGITAGPDGAPAGITAGPDGALWFTLESGQIGRITTAGAITAYQVPSAFSTPVGITAGSDGALWFTDQAASKIGRIITSGAITEYPLPSNTSFPVSITAAPDGALWFTEGSNIGRITTAGIITSFPIPSSPIAEGIASGPDGRLWFAEESGAIGHAPACGLGFSASFRSGTLTMKFNLGSDFPAAFNILLHSSAGISRPFTKQIPAASPPRAFTLTWPGIPDLGEVTVQPLLAMASGTAACSEWTTVNTAQ